MLDPVCRESSDECGDPSQQCDIGVCPESNQPVGHCPETAEDSRLELEAQGTGCPEGCGLIRSPVRHVLPGVGDEERSEAAGEACALSESSG